MSEKARSHLSNLPHFTSPPHHHEPLHHLQLWIGVRRYRREPCLPGHFGSVGELCSQVLLKGRDRCGAERDAPLLQIRQERQSLLLLPHQVHQKGGCRGSASEIDRPHLCSSQLPQTPSRSRRRGRWRPPSLTRTHHLRCLLCALLRPLNPALRRERPSKRLMRYTARTTRI